MLKIFLLTFCSAASENIPGAEDALFNLQLLILKAFAEEHPEIRDNTTIEQKTYPLSANEEEILECIFRYSPDILGFSAYVWNLEKSIQIARKAKCILPGLKTVFGGPEIDDTKRILQKYPSIDFIIKGEGEVTFLELLRHFLSGAPEPAAIDGLSFRDSGGIVANADRQEIANLDSIPSVYTEETLRRHRIVYYETSRGCRCGCIYCHEGMPGKRYYSLERVEKDLSLILSQRHIKTLNFIDTVLDDDLRRSKELLRIIAKYNLNRITCGGYFYFSNADEELFRLMKEANFIYARTGVESTDSDILKEIGRGANNVSRLDLAYPYRDSIRLTPYIIIFLPNDTPDNFKKTVKDCFDKGYLFLDFHCTRLRIYPGTAIYRNAEKYGYVFDHDPPHFVYSNNTFSYDDFIVARHLIANIVIQCSIFEVSDMKVLNECDYDIFRASMNIHDVIPEWRNCYQHLSEDVLTEISFGAEAFDLLCDYVSTSVKPARSAANIVKLIEKRKSKYERRAE